MTTVRAGFGAEVARRLTQVTYRQLDYWDRTGLVRPSVQKARGKESRRVYAFEDLVELRVVARLLAVGIKLPAVRAAARYMTANFSNVTRPLARLTLLVDGKRILIRVQDGDALVDASRGGQILIAVPVGVIAEELGRTVSDLRAPRQITFGAAGASYVAVLTPDLEVGGFSVSVPELPGVCTEGDTVAEARSNVVEAVTLWLDAQGGRVTRRRAARRRRPPTPPAAPRGPRRARVPRLELPPLKEVLSTPPVETPEAMSILALVLFEGREVVEEREGETATTQSPTLARACHLGRQRPPRRRKLTHLGSGAR